MTQVKVTTAVELTKSELEAIHKKIAKKVNDEISIDATVDPDVVGGIRIRVGSHQLDGTIAAKLDQLKQQLLTL